MLVDVLYKSIVYIDIFMIVRHAVYLLHRFVYARQVGVRLCSTVYICFSMLKGKVVLIRLKLCMRTHCNAGRVMHVVTLPDIRHLKDLEGLE